MNDKKNICILFGGRSGEHEVSLVSAYNVIKAINKDKYELTFIGISKDGEWSLYSGDTEKIANGSWESDAGNRRGFSLFSDEQINNIDLFFPVLHGTFGEDGTIQGLFEMLNKPYAGCGVLASSAAMDKIVTKEILAQNGINTAKGITVSKTDLKNKPDEVIKQIESAFNFPVFVKPANMGSSVGISKASDRAQFIAAVEEAAKYDTRILVEEAVIGSEIEVAVLGNDEPVASYPGMIVPCNDFYDYEAKYMTGDESKVIIPAPISDEKTNQIRATAVKAYKALCCSGLSRVDFFLEKDTQRVIINEINTMPGFTNISMYPKLWQHSGIEYSALIDRLIELGFERYNTRKELRFKK